MGTQVNSHVYPGRIWRKKERDLLGPTVPSVVPMGMRILVPLNVMSMIGMCGDDVDVIELRCDRLRKKKKKTYWFGSKQNQVYKCMKGEKWHSV